MTDAERANTLTRMRALADVAQEQAETLNGLLGELNGLLDEEESDDEDGDPIGDQEGRGDARS